MDALDPAAWRFYEALKHFALAAGGPDASDVEAAGKAILARVDELFAEARTRPLDFVADFPELLVDYSDAIDVWLKRHPGEGVSAGIVVTLALKALGAALQAAQREVARLQERTLH